VVAASYQVLFVCTGNICRSPLAEALFAHFVDERGLGARYSADSAGLQGWHQGEPADARTRHTAGAHGIDVTSRSRRVRPADFQRFELIVAMDRGHLEELQAQCPEELRDKLELMRQHDDPPGAFDVPDPYYGQGDGFERVHAMLARCTANLLDALETGRHRRAPRLERPNIERA